MLSFVFVSLYRPPAVLVVGGLTNTRVVRGAGRRPVSVHSNGTSGRVCGSRARFQRALDYLLTFDSRDPRRLDEGP